MSDLSKESNEEKRLRLIACLEWALKLLKSSKDVRAIEMGFILSRPAIQEPVDSMNPSMYPKITVSDDRFLTISASCSLHKE